MKEDEKDLIRKLMYGNIRLPEDGIKNKKLKEIKIVSTPKSIVIESDGKRHQIPTLNVFNALLSECNTLRNNQRDTQTSIKKLTETIKKLDAALKNAERDILTKADRFDT